MINVRYKDREFLKKYSLDLELFKKFSLDVKDVIPVRKVFIVVTDEGEYILKKLDYSIEDLMFINDGLEYVKNNGFKRVFNFKKDKNEKIYVDYKNNKYCVMELLRGRESVYSNPIDVGLGAEALSLLHKSSIGFTTKIKKKDLRGKLIEDLKDKLNNIIVLKKVIKRYQIRNEIDKIFLQNVDYFIDKAEISLSILEDSSYYSLCKEKDKVAFCHNDLAYHNILIKNEKAYFIDFDYAIIDLKIHDIANYICKVIRKFAYDINKVEFIINKYKENNFILQEELEVLYGILLFPHSIINLFNNYYFREKDWDYDTFLQKINQKIQYKNEKEEFIKLFKDRYIDQNKNM